MVTAWSDLLLGETNLYILYIEAERNDQLVNNTLLFLWQPARAWGGFWNLDSHGWTVVAPIVIIARNRC